VSPLTKIFVMLLVVVSLLDAAATVVYVNKSQTTQQDYQALSAKNTALQRDNEVAVADAAAARGQLIAQEQLSANQAAANQASLDKAQADLASMDAENKQLLRNNEAQEANLQGLNAQLGIALQTNQQQGQTLTDLRDANAKLVQSQAENDAALAAQRQLADTYGRQAEYLTEQLKKTQDLVKAYASVITENHLTLPAAATPAAYSGPPVSGVVQQLQQINGITYVTISVGSTDNVQPGMQFRVVDTSVQPHEFLGIVTVTQTQANSAIGRLQADARVQDQVRKGNEVTTDVVDF
jgi:hypothetical protein